MKAQQLYTEFCATEQSIPIFSQPWWLDAVCGKDGWDVCLVEKNKQILGALPFHRSRQAIFRVIRMPPLTQNFRLWIKYPDSQKYEKRLSHEKAVITTLIKQLPRFDYCRIQLYHSLTNWLPFYWQGFSQSTQYTYVINDLTDLDGVFSRFSHAKRKDLKKSEGTVCLGPELTAREFYEHHAMTLRKQNATISYSYDLFERIHAATDKRECGKIFTAMDGENRIHAAIFVVWDSVQAYYLVSSIDPEYKTSGAATYLVKEAITHVSTRTTRFDLEGSMIEGVENSFRRFGAIQVPYFAITKIPSKLLLFRQLLRESRRQ